MSRGRHTFPLHKYCKTPCFRKCIQGLLQQIFIYFIRLASRYIAITSTVFSKTHDDLVLETWSPTLLSHRLLPHSLFSHISSFSQNSASCVGINVLPLSFSNSTVHPIIHSRVESQWSDIQACLREPYLFSVSTQQTIVAELLKLQRSVFGELVL